MRCPGCGNSVKKTIKMGLGTFCIHCIKYSYTSCKCCNKLIRNTSILSQQGVQSKDSIRYEEIFEKYKTICNTCFNDLKKTTEPKQISTCESCETFCSYRVKHKQLGVILCDFCEHRLYTCDICESPNLNLYGNRKYHKESFTYNNDNTQNSEQYLTICVDCSDKLSNDEEVLGWKYCKRCRKLSKEDKIDNNFCNTCYNNGYRFCESCKKCYGIYKEEPKDLNMCYVCACREGCIDIESIKCRKCGDPCFNHNYNNFCRKCIGKINIDHGVSDGKNCIPFERYNYIPKYFYYHGKENKDTLLIGTEHEVWCEYKDERNKILSDLYKNYNEKYIYIKFDGSIEGREGFEVVTHPMSYRKLICPSKFPFNSEKQLSCGMHVHLSKNFFDRITLFKFINFLYNNDTLINYIAGREPNHHCRKLPEKGYVYKFAKNKVNVNIRKYTQVNLLHPKTVELRMFAQASSPEDWKKNVQFAVFLANFCKDKSFKNITLDYMIDYLEITKNIYPELHTFISKKNIEELRTIKEKKKPVRLSKKRGKVYNQGIPIAPVSIF